MHVTDTIQIGDKVVYSKSIVSPVLYPPNGEMFAVSVVYRDVTEQRLLQEELKASQDRFKRLAEASSEAIAIHREDKLVDVNPQYLELFGYTFDEALATPGLNMIAPQSRKIVSERIASGNEEVYKAIGLRKDGSTFPMEIRIRTSSIDGQPVRIVVLREIGRAHV